jgi:heterodisulfide reductase subunit A2
VCQAKAINFEDRDREEEIHVGSIVLTPGLKTYQPEIRQEFGFGKYKNVITSLQFERLLSASGPCGGVVTRPSDGGHPKRIAMVQCVGSRNAHNANPWCSSVCCMYAAKQSIIAKEHDKEVQSTVFYMELRAFGKDFDKYIDKAKNDAGVIYKRAMISQVDEDPATGNLLVHSVGEDGRTVREEFDMVVLSIGFEPREDAAEFSKIFSIDTDTYGFAKTSKLTPVATSRPGIFVAGTYQGPKGYSRDGDSGQWRRRQGHGPARRKRGTEVTKVVLPDERDITDEESRVGVIVCHCGTNIAGTVDVKKVAEVASHEPGWFMPRPSFTPVPLTDSRRFAISSRKKA